MTNKTTDITKPQNNLPVSSADQGAWGAPPKLSPKDIIIPRILLMQGMSDKVTAGEASFGDLRDSVSGEMLGNPKQPLQVIPFSMKKAIIVSEWDAKSKDYEYKEMIDATPENEALPYEEAGFKRQRVVSFFVLLPSDIAKGGAIPKLISMKGSSTQAAKIIATQMFAINATASPWLPPSAYVMEISTKIDKNDKGTFSILEAKRGRASTPEEVALSLQWFKSIQQASPKIDEEKEDLELKATATAVFQSKTVEKEVKAAPAKAAPQGDLRDPPNF